MVTAATIIEKRYSLSSASVGSSGGTRKGPPVTYRPGTLSLAVMYFYLPVWIVLENLPYPIKEYYVAYMNWLAQNFFAPFLKP